MASHKAYGRAFPIRKADVGAYRMAARPKGYRPNPMGVTTLSAVNGPGAYARAHGSARAATHGLSRAERVARARRLMENRSGSMQSNSVHRAAFVRKMNENRGGTRRAAMRVSKRRGSPMRRNKSPPTGAEARAYAAAHEGIYGKGKKPRKSRKAAAAAAPAAAAAAAPASTPARRARISKTVKAAQKRIKAAEKKYAAAQKGVERAKTQAEASAQREKKAIEKAKIRIEKMKIAEAKRNTPDKVARRKRAAVKRKWPKQSRTQGRGKTKRRVRVAYGPYRRASLSHPRRGGRVLSYMTRSKGKALRKIPAWAIAGAISAKDYKTEGAYQKAKTRIAARRKAAAKRAEAGWDAFTPNSGAGHMYENKSKKKKRKKKAASRKKAGTRTRRRSAKRTSAKRSKRRSKKRSTKRAATTRRRRRSAKKSTTTRRRRSTKRKTATRRRRVSAKSASPRKRRRSTKRKTATRRRRSTSRKTTTRRKRRSGVPRRIGRRKVRRLRKGLYFIANRRGGRYTMNGFASDLKTLLKTGALVLTGFFVHKALTGVVAKALVSADGTKFAGMALMTAEGKASIIGQWARPLTGAVVGAAGIAAVSMVPGKAETRMAVGAGMMVSWLESVVKTALLASDQSKALSYLEGYSNSPAYALRGARGRRGMRGLGVARNANSIMPQFAPIGSFQQAAAGMGEFFTPQAGMGEYFAGPGTQGVGFYEKAGPLALQPGRSHMGQLPVDDGIRPDANLDHVLDLAESAAGLGQGFQQAAAGTGAFQQAAAGLGRHQRRGVRGMGEFFTASPSGDGFAENSVPTQSQWIPNGPLWAGSTPAEAHYTESELPAGILQGSGGNGVLSGG